MNKPRLIEGWDKRLAQRLATVCNESARWDIDALEYEDGRLTKLINKKLEQQAQLTRRETIEEILVELDRISPQFHGGGNGRRLLIELAGKIQSLINKEDEKKRYYGNISH